MSVSASQILASQPPSPPPSQRAPSQRDAASQGAMRLTIPAPAPDRTERVAPDSFNNAEVGEAPGSGTSEGLSFFDFLDLINPLQHIPIVSSIYRELTGDTIRPEMQMAGAALLGGPVGLLVGSAHAVFEAENGRGVGEEMLAQIGFGGNGGTAATRLAAAPQPAAAPEPAIQASAKTAVAADAEMPAQPEMVALNTGQATGLDALVAASNRRKDGEGAKVIARFQVSPQMNASQANASQANGAEATAQETVPSTPSAQNGGVPSLMQDALQKYEALMRARQRGETPQ